MKHAVLEVLEVRSAKTRKIRTPDVKSRKYNGSPNLKLKRVKTETPAKDPATITCLYPAGGIEAIREFGSIERLNQASTSSIQRPIISPLN